MYQSIINYLNSSLARIIWTLQTDQVDVNQLDTEHFRLDYILSVLRAYEDSLELDPRFLNLLDQARQVLFRD